MTKNHFKTGPKKKKTERIPFSLKLQFFITLGQNSENPSECIKGGGGGVRTLQCKIICKMNLLFFKHINIKISYTTYIFFAETFLPCKGYIFTPKNNIHFGFIC